MNYQFNQSSVEQRLSDLEKQIRELREAKARAKLAATTQSSDGDEEMADLRKQLEKLRIRIEIAKLEKELEGLA